MQDDRSLTFRQIHGDKETLLSAVQDIERIALVESYEIGPLRLRFLEPYPQGGSKFGYILTPAREIRLADLNNYDYIAVSYVWTHSQPLDGIKLPVYRIWDGANLEKPPRLLKCPPIVFHRVVQYAEIAKLERIWIDQECIDQDDPNDVEKHLQDMHRIYRFSRMTVAVLSKVSRRWEGLISLLQVDIDRSHLIDRMQIVGTLLSEMIDNPWFTRSWTFHEQHCATDIVFLLPTPPTHEYQLDSLKKAFMKGLVLTLGNDVCVSEYKLQSYCYLREEVHRDNTCAILKSYFVGHGHVSLVSADAPGAIETVQRQMEKRENQVLSDRIQIIANVCGLGWKLKTTLLNNPTQSYSTCLLALTMANTWSDPAERALQYRAFGDAFMGVDIEGALRELRNAQRRDLWHLPGFRPDFVEPYKGS